MNGTRKVVLMNRDDIERIGLREGKTIKLATASNDRIVRELAGLRVTPYDIPASCIGTYNPEANVSFCRWATTPRAS